MSMIFKGTLTIYFLIAIVALVAAGSVLLRPPAALAHVDLETVPVETIEVATGESTTVAESDILFGSYVYRAEKGDNLTYLARRSVQLYLATSMAELDVAQMIAVETLIVRDLGGFELAVGQEVSIDVSLVGQKVYEAYLLDAASLAHWGMYAPVRQSLEHIEPLEVPQSLAFEQEIETEPETVVIETAVDGDGAAGSESGAVTEAETTEEAYVSESEVEIVADNATATRDSSFYFTLLGGLILMGIIVWVLVLSFLRNTKDELEEASLGEDSAKLKDRIADAKLTQKVKDLPKKAASKRGRPAQKAKPVKKKPTRGKRKK